MALGKLRLPRPLPAILADNGFLERPILLRHTEALGALPDHHRDPFDRLLVAQAYAEGLTLVTRDPPLARYPVAVLRACGPRPPAPHGSPSCRRGPAPILPSPTGSPARRVGAGARTSGDAAVVRVERATPPLAR